MKYSDAQLGLGKDADARKQAPMFRGLIKYFPDACAYVGRVSYKGNEQHNPGEPMRWAREKSTDQEDCIIRHLANVAKGQDYDTDRLLHLGKVAWRALAALQLKLEEIEAVSKMTAEPTLPGPAPGLYEIDEHGNAKVIELNDYQPERRSERDAQIARTIRYE